MHTVDLVANPITVFIRKTQQRWLVGDRPHFLQEGPGVGFTKVPRGPISFRGGTEEPTSGGHRQTQQRTDPFSWRQTRQRGIAMTKSAT
jgi:hypothetical protein